MRIRRSSHCFLRLERRRFLDLGALLRGSVDWLERPRVVASGLLDGREHVLEAEHLELLLRVPGVWTAATGLAGTEEDRQRLDDLLAWGLVLSEAADDDARERLQDERRLSARGWFPAAAYYHYLARWQGIQGAGTGSEPTPGLTELPAHPPDDPPPPAFPPAHPGDEVSLAEGTLDSPLAQLLEARGTCRSFDPDRPLSAGNLAVLLRQVFGARGIARRSGGLTLLRKSSPSGGALHPIEAYVLVQNVDGLDPGIYHYEVGGHRLRTLERRSAPEIGDLVLRGTAGQPYFAAAAVGVVLVARFQRNFWKYRHHAKAYRVLLLDAAHLSQTLALVATDLGLGSFITSAINEVDLEQALGLDPLEHGVVAVCGAGPKGPKVADYELGDEPFVPGGIE